MEDEREFSLEVLHQVTETQKIFQSIYCLKDAFCSNQEGNENKDYIQNRFDYIHDYINNVGNKNSDIKFNFNSTKGALDCQSSYCSRECLMRLAKQNHNSALYDGTINVVANIINVNAYIMGSPIPEIVVISTNNMTKATSLSDSSTSCNNRSGRREEDALTIRNLRFRCSKIAMFPLLIHGTFFLVVLLTKKAKAFVLSCRQINKFSMEVQAEIKVIILLILIEECYLSFIFIIKSKVCKLIYNFVFTNFSPNSLHINDWTIYNDGSDPSFTCLFEEGEEDMDCGVYICCYMMDIAFSRDIDEVVDLFDKKKYAELFTSIRRETIIYKRKVLTVMITDAESFQEKYF